MVIKSFPHYHQQESADCGPACLRMIAKYYGRLYSLEMLREHSFISREGVSMLELAAIEGGLTIELEDYCTEKNVGKPCVYARGYINGHEAVAFGVCAVKYKQVGSNIIAEPYCV